MDRLPQAGITPRVPAKCSLARMMVCSGLQRRHGRDAPSCLNSRGESAFPPVEHPERAEGVPAARLPRVTLQGEVDAAGMDAVKQPAAVRLPL
jgi:hypothetical protein